MTQGKIINWTPSKLAGLKREYEKHKDNKEDTFVFEGDEFVVGYAKYLIEYLDGKFKESKTK